MNSPVGAERFPAPERLEITLDPVPLSARIAREALRALTTHRDHSVAALVVSELVTNAVQHARSAPQLRAEKHGRSLWIEVTDDGPGWPTLEGGLPLAPSGRGLYLVDQIAEAWGVYGHPGPPRTKAIWARIDITP